MRHLQDVRASGEGLRPVRLVSGVLADLDALAVKDMCGTTCPACHAERRGKHDRRPAVAWRSARNWVCAACNVGGGPVQWLAWATFGRKPTGSDWRDLKTAAEQRGWLTGEVRHVAPREQVEAAPRYPPPDEVRDLWARCDPLSGPAWDWVVSRGIDARLVRRWDLARCLPRTDLPTWAECWRGGWWLVLPAYDDRGELVTFRARWVRQEAPRCGAKAKPPKGYEARGSILLGPAAFEAAGDVLVVEGEPAFLYAATRAQTVPVVGVFAGAGSPRLWRSMRGRVILATDADEPGDRYADRIGRSCWSSVRVRPPQGQGWDDACLGGWTPGIVL